MSRDEPLAANALSLLVVLARLLAVPGSVLVGFAALLAGCAGRPDWMTACFAGSAALGAFAFANLLTRHVLIPFGRVKLAYAYTRVLHPLLALGEAQAAAIFVGYQALRRRSAGRAELLGWLDERAARRVPVRGAFDLVVHAERHAARGEPERARPLYEAAFQLRGRRMSGGSAARTHATWWLLADDAIRGDWDAVLARAPRDRRDDSALECFPEAVARVLGRQSPLGGGLLGVWLGEGAVSGALRWMIRAERADPAPAPEPPPRTGDALADAIRTHAYVLALPRTEVRAPDLVRVGEAWARVEAAEGVRRRISGRIAELDVRTDAESVFERLRARVVDDLVGVVERMCVAVPAEAEGPAAAAIERVWDARVARLGDQVEELGRRMEDGRMGTSPEAWAAWAGVRAGWEAAARVASPGRRRELFDTFDRALCRVGVWLAKERGDRYLAHAMFSFLADEAEVVGSVEDVAFYEKNARVTR